jgi:hypothetical protein
VRNGETLRFNARDVLEKGMTSTISLQSGDWIVVPQRNRLSLQAFLTGLQVVSALTVITTRFID